MGTRPADQHDQMQKKIIKEIFRNAMSGNWEAVLTTYKENSEVRQAKITRSGDTALHIAVLDGGEDVAKRLVGLLGNDAKEVLKIKNERGDTPLHLAAARGSVEICKCIVSVDKELIGVHNNENETPVMGVHNNESETPFFSAALNGKTDAFVFLHQMCADAEEGYKYCRKNNGDTTLHAAIKGEYFDLAFQIIHDYKNLVNYVNEEGLSPLHLLATMPTTFRSGSHLGRFDKIIYFCTFVDKLKPDTAEAGQSLLQTPKQEESIFPKNYEICVNFIDFWKTVFKHITPGNKTPEEADTESQTQSHQMFPPNYDVCFDLVKFMSKALIIVLGFGSTEIRKVQHEKKKHIWSMQIMDELLRHSSTYEYEDDGQRPQNLQLQKEGETTPYHIDDHVENNSKGGLEQTGTPMTPTPTPTPKTSTVATQNIQNKEAVVIQNVEFTISGQKRQGKGSIMVASAILIAAKNGITEMVEKILKQFPVGIHDMNQDEKNIVLLAVENRQSDVYELLRQNNFLKESVFRKVDKDGNSVLHLAAMLGEHRPWLIAGAALQMQWEIKWYEFVKDSMPPHFFTRQNSAGLTPNDIFTETHKNLVETGGQWLINTSQSCSVVAALITTVAFATSSTVPGGTEEGSGKPNLEDEPPFDIFAISSLVALCFSVTALVMFLAILTSRYQEKDFHKNLPRKLLFGLTSLFVSITAMLISFCAGHFFVLKDQLKFAAYPVYAVTCLPVTFFAIAQFPLYFDLIWATFKKIPKRGFKMVTS